jgi:hypothetical protein
MSDETKNPTEAEMRDSEAPTHGTVEELAAYVRVLVERPHDYGTCVYAMSLAATAAFNFVAHKLGVTMFQASWGDNVSGFVCRHGCASQDPWVQARLHGPEW